MFDLVVVWVSLGWASWFVLLWVCRFVVCLGFLFVWAYGFEVAGVGVVLRFGGWVYVRLFC